MKLTFALALVAAVIWAPLAGAQAPSTDEEIELTRLTIQAKRNEIVSTAIDLEPDESEAFWPLYRDWRAKIAGLGDRRVKIIRQVNEEYDLLTDTEARSILDEWVRIEGQELKLRKQYIKRFRRILPEKKVARFFQLENKMNVTVYYDLVGTVPLIEQDARK